MLRPSIAFCMLLFIHGCYHNPVSKKEAQKYVIPKADDKVIVICRIVLDPETLTSMRQGWKEQKLIIDKLLDSGYTMSTFSCLIGYEEWHCFELSPGSYCVRNITSVRDSSSYATGHVAVTSTMYEIQTEFSVPRVPAVYIGTLQQAKNGQWDIKDESANAERMLRQMKPAYKGRVFVELARVGETR